MAATPCEAISGSMTVVGLLLRRDGFGESAVAHNGGDLHDQLGHDVVRRANAAVSAELQSQSEHLVGAVVHDLVGTEADEQPLHRIEVEFREFVAGDIGNREQRGQFFDGAGLAGEARECSRRSPAACCLRLVRRRKPRTSLPGIAAGEWGDAADRRRPRIRAAWSASSLAMAA